MSADRALQHHRRAPAGPAQRADQPTVLESPPARPLPLSEQGRILVGSADDRAEREADRVAHSVIERLTGWGSPRTQVPHHAVPSVDVLRRTADGAGGAVIGRAGGEVDTETDRQLRSSAGGGAPLPTSVRVPLESAFGSSLSAVRLHTGTTAATLNRRLSAEAFTHGDDIYFRQGPPDATTRHGIDLLVHEIAHAVQHHRGGNDSGSVRRFLLINGTTYTKARPPDGSILDGLGELKNNYTNFLDSDTIGYYPSGDNSVWLKDANLSLYNLGQKDGKTSIPSVAGTTTDAALGTTGPARATPKHPERRKVSTIRLYKRISNPYPGKSIHEIQDGAHWELECLAERDTTLGVSAKKADGSDKKDKVIKIDLIADGYRIYYGATPIGPDQVVSVDDATTKQRVITITDRCYEPPAEFRLEAPATVKQVYTCAIEVAKTLGAFRGQDELNCQDFALAMLKRMNVKGEDQQQLASEEKWRKERLSLQAQYST